MRMKAALILLLFFLFSACAPADDAVRIGIIAPFSGENAHFGEAVRNGATMALEESGDTERQYELVFEDDKLDPKLTSSAAQKLITVDGADAIVSFSSAAGNVVSPIAQESGIVHFGLASDTSVAQGQYNFIHWTPPEEVARTWVEEAQRRGYHRIALVYGNQQGIIAVIDLAKSYLEEVSIDIVSEQKFNFGETDFRTAILKARNTGPDAYLIMGFSPELEILYRQMKEAGIEEPISSIESFGLSSDPLLFEGEWYAHAGESTSEFLERYVRRYGDDAPLLGAGNVYDAVSLIINAYETAPGTPTSEEISVLLHGVREYPGAMGTLRIDGSGIVWSPASLKEIRNNTLIALDNAHMTP